MESTIIIFHNFKTLYKQILITLQKTYLYNLPGNFYSQLINLCGKK